MSLNISAHSLHQQGSFDAAWLVFERLRGQALKAESAQQWSRAMKLWLNGFEVADSTEVKSVSSLEKALILRRIVMLNEKREQSEQYYASQPLLNCQALLEESLRLDPKDKTTYLQLIDLALDTGNIQAYQRWAGEAVRQLPDNRDVLDVAIEAANARYDYIQAAEYAKTLFELDGINFQAKRLFVEACLNHIRKQVKKKEYRQAKSWIDDALSMKPADALLLQVQIVEVLLLQQMGSAPSLTRSLLNAIAHRLNNNLLFSFVLLVEAVQLGANATQFVAAFKQNSLVQKTEIGHDELIALVSVIEQYWEADFIAIKYLVAVHFDQIQQAAKKLSVADHYIRFCDVLCQIEAFDEALWFALRARRLFPDHPVFSYYEIYSFAKGDPSLVGDWEHEELKKVIHLLDVDDFRKFLTDVVVFLNAVDEIADENSL